MASLRVVGDDGEERDRDLTAEEEERSNKLLEKRAKLDARIEEENKKSATQNMLAEARKNAGLEVAHRADSNGADMSVEKEPKVYGYGSNNSFFADMYYTTYRSPIDAAHQAALARQVEWSNQVEHELAEGSRFGRDAEKQFREHFREGGVDWKKALTECRDRGRYSARDKGAELRSLTTGGGATASASGGGVAAFVTPIFTESDYVVYREFGRAFANAVTQRPLPPYGK